MEHRVLGKTGLNVSVLGFGGAEIGFEQAAPEAVERLLLSALDAGLNTIDTAECYNAGDSSSEELIGRAIAHRRDDFHLFTKCGHAAIAPYKDWDIEMLELSIDRSLQRLKTDHLDLIQLHTCSREQLEQGDVIAVLQRARDAGKTRFIGYSGDNEAALYAVECGQFDTLQTSLNIADQRPLDLYLDKAQAANMGVIAKRPIANAAWKHNGPPPSDYHKPYYERLQQLDYDFLRGDAAEGVSIALRWTLACEGVHTAIVGTQNPARWAQNAKLLESGPLPQAQFDSVRARYQEVAREDWTGKS